MESAFENFAALEKIQQVHQRRHGARRAREGSLTQPARQDPNDAFAADESKPPISTPARLGSTLESLQNAITAADAKLATFEEEPKAEWSAGTRMYTGRSY
jgi:hypothetical protein